MDANITIEFQGRTSERIMTKKITLNMITCRCIKQGVGIEAGKDLTEVLRCLLDHRDASR